MGKERNQTIDIMKGLGMLLVIIGHFWHPWHVATIIWSFHMPLFVILSGVFLKKTSWKSVKKNAFSLLIPYVITCSIQHMINYLKDFVRFGKILTAEDFKNVIISIIAGQGNAESVQGINGVINVEAVHAAWFFLALFEGLIIAGIIIKIKNIVIRYLITFGLIIVALMLKNYGFIWGNIQGGVMLTMWLLIGYDFQSYNVWEKLKKYKIIILGIWIFVVGIDIISNNALSICDVNFMDITWWIEIVGAICGVSLVYDIASFMKEKYENKIIIDIGKSTKTILSLHSLDIACFSMIWSVVLGIVGITSPLIIMLCRLVVTILFAKCFDLFYKNYIKIRN